MFLGMGNYIYTQSNPILAVPVRHLKSDQSQTDGLKCYCYQRCCTWYKSLVFVVKVLVIILVLDILQ